DGIRYATVTGVQTCALPILLFAKLAHFRECANLRFKGLIVLALDLKLRLEFFHEQVQMGNLDAKLLDVGRCGSCPDRSCVRLLEIGRARLNSSHGSISYAAV